METQNFVQCPACQGKSGEWHPDGVSGHGCGAEFVKTDCGLCNNTGKVSFEIQKKYYYRKIINSFIFWIVFIVALILLIRFC
jgi:hypothetical protein